MVIKTYVQRYLSHFSLHQLLIDLNQYELREAGNCILFTTCCFQSQIALVQATKTAQPEAIAPMVVAGGGNKNVNELPYDSNGKRDWSFGLYDCFAQSKKCP